MVSLVGSGLSLSLSTGKGVALGQASGSGLIPAGLVASWMPALDYFSGITAQTVTDRSGNGNTLTLGSTGGVDPNDPAWSRQGLVFNGTSQYASAGNPTGLQIVGRITIGAVVNVTAFPASGAVQRPIGKGSTGTNPEAYDVDIFNSAGTLLLRSGSWNGVTGTQAAWTISGWTTGTWHYLTGTWDGSGWRVYFDGALKATLAGGQGGINTGAPLLVGAYQTSGLGVTSFFNGSVGAAHIYNVALTPSQVTQQYTTLRRMLAPAGVTLP